MKIFVTGDAARTQQELPTELRGEKLLWRALPVLDFERLPVPGEVVERVTASPFGWIVFTSARSVQFWTQALLEAGVDFPLEIQVACIGEATAQAAELDGFSPDFFPVEPSTEGFLEEFAGLIESSFEKPSILIPSAEQGRPLLKQSLADLGCEVVWLPLYRTRAKADLGPLLGELGGISSPHAIVFTSPSSVDAVMQATIVSQSAQLVAIGQFTANRLRELGHSARILPQGDLRRVVEVL